MQEFFRIDRIGPAIAAATAALLFARTSEADKGRQTSAACVVARGAVDSAHSSERSANPGEALEAYRSCAAQNDCGWLASRCSAKVKMLEAKLPSIVIVANDEAGEPVADVDVRVDGVLRASKLEGTAMAVTPGLHELTLTGAGSLSAAQRVMVIEGERGRIVKVTIRAKPMAAANAAVETATSSPSPRRGSAQASPDAAQPSGASTAEDRPSAGSDGAAGVQTAKVDPASAPALPARTHWQLPRSPLPYTLAAVGLTGVAAGILTTVWGNKDNGELEDRCSPNCSPSSQSHIKTLYAVADVSYGVGIAALGVATWMFASSRAEERAPAAATIVDVRPLPSGALASVTGHF